MFRCFVVVEFTAAQTDTAILPFSLWHKVQKMFLEISVNPLKTIGEAALSNYGTVSKSAKNNKFEE